MGKLDGRVALVSGAARGQGEQEARLFAAEGAKVVLGDVLDERGERVAAELGAESAAYVHLDVRSEESWQAAAEAAERRFGPVDALVNNAGILRFHELAATPVEEFREVIEVNQTGCFLGMKTLVPYIERAGGGTIVNTASYAAMAGMAFLTAYAASKAAIVGMTRVASMELAGKGVRVNAMCPGAIDTPMTNPAKAAESGLRVEGGGAGELDAFYAKLIPQGRVGRPEEVARLALFLSCEDSSYVTGQPFVIDGGWLAGVSVL
ncbi:SDR family oxidoreductase [Streptomyces sp. NBC_01795]|uniref:SDR family NAD(P)-dependent oxidoreductase n=1 Tax=unclassified Streptomyces TaxID=2593676 RepID=UPI002DDC8E56|nr:MULTISPECIES: SDR family NAD(P)-dependent oxidoreductase [unclassified Streptomyces]WSA94087.1 SDR family oxidoreductase [Streptomyces sp. NBC_01795]WSB78512.1 SDR family oxidoreductase [Streptomyces sp. NBC_01775]